MVTDLELTFKHCRSLRRAGREHGQRFLFNRFTIENVSPALPQTTAL